MQKKDVRRIVPAAMLAVVLVFGAALISILRAGPGSAPEPAPDQTSYLHKTGDEELAYLLVKLELKTRGVIGDHYTRAQARFPGVDLVYQRWLAKNTILPAAVADRVFSEVVPGATGGRAWVKMVVQDPRNDNNRGDSVALEMLHAIQDGSPSEERSRPEAYYYAEPIKATEVCLPCHGEPKGRPDPIFPEYEKDGWKPDDIVGAVISRVAPRQVADSMSR